MKTIIILLAVLLAACGGSTDTATPDESTPVAQTVELPDIVDNYSDGVFKYADPQLYNGDYAITNTPEDTCAEFFGYAMPTTVEIVSASTNSLIIITNGQQDTVYYTHPDNSDIYFYFVSYQDFGISCGFFLTSKNSDTVTKTLDGLTLYCIDEYSTASCAVAHVREAAYDFTSRTIKSGNPVDAIKRMME